MDIWLYSLQQFIDIRSLYIYNTVSIIGLKSTTSNKLMLSRRKQPTQLLLVIKILIINDPFWWIVGLR